MRILQKFMKSFAIILAIGLATCIFGSVFMVIAVIGSIFDRSDMKVEINKLEVVDIKKEDYLSLDIELESSSLIIKEGSSFGVRTNNKYVDVSVEGKRLIVSEREHLINDISNLVVVYIPYNYEFVDFSIESLAGSIEIDKLVTKKLDFDLGAGKLKIDNLFVLDDAEIEGGTGSIEINNGNINNLDLDLGVGKFVMKVKLLGNNFINCGLGESKITLMGYVDDYKVNISKGIGDAIVGDKIVSNNTVCGTGNVNVNIDGGVGSIVVKYSNQQV